VTCRGHIIGAILAETKIQAQRAAKAVKVTYEDLEPIITIEVKTTVDYLFAMKHYLCLLSCIQWRFD